MFLFGSVEPDEVAWCNPLSILLHYHDAGITSMRRKFQGRIWPFSKGLEADYCSRQHEFLTKGWHRSRKSPGEKYVCIHMNVYIHTVYRYCASIMLCQCPNTVKK